ncbi:MAG TPA: helix-turn-helix domain-containing protein [Candidatus Paceibacterota bacterium]
MVRNQAKREQAIAFRKRGFTLEEIAKICEVSKSTVSKWLKNNDFSDEITAQNKRRAGLANAKRLQLMTKARRAERQHRYEEVDRNASLEFKHFKKDPLFWSGLSIYQAIGDQRNQRVIRLTSHRMTVHKNFIRFALEYLGVPKNKVKFWILLYPEHDEERCMRKWQRVIGLPFSQFYKNQYSQRVQQQTLHHGVGNTIIGSTVLKRRLIRWIELAEKEL